VFYEFVLLEEVTEQQFHRMFDTNVLGMLLVTQEGLKHFKSKAEALSILVRWPAL